MEFFYTDGYHTHGPFSLDELLSKKIDSETWINIRGTKDWIKAKEVEALKGKITPPIRKRKKRLTKSGQKKVALDHNKVKEQLEAQYAKKKEKVQIKIIDLDSREKIKSHSFSSIVALFGITILGIIALVKSSQINSLLSLSSDTEARKKSKVTRQLAYSGIFFAAGIFFWFTFAGGFVSSFQSIVYESYDLPSLNYY